MSQLLASESRRGGGDDLCICSSWCGKQRTTSGSAVFGVESRGRPVSVALGMKSRGHPLYLQFLVWTPQH